MGNCRQTGRVVHHSRWWGQQAHPDKSCSPLFPGPETERCPRSSIFHGPGCSPRRSTHNPSRSRCLHSCTARPNSGIQAFQSLDRGDRSRSNRTVRALDDPDSCCRRSPCQRCHAFRFVKDRSFCAHPGGAGRLHHLPPMAWQVKSRIQAQRVRLHVAASATRQSRYGPDHRTRGRPPGHPLSIVMFATRVVQRTRH